MKRILITLAIVLFVFPLAKAQDIQLNGTVSAQNNQIKNVANPIDAQDATTKSYVDNAVISTQQASDITTNNAKVSFPGFGIIAGTALEGNTSLFSGSYNDLADIPVVISTQQASNITTNNAKVSFPGFGITAGTALEGNTSLFSGSYNDLADIPVVYTQDQVDMIIENLRTELENQIDNDGDGYSEDGGDCDDNNVAISPNGNEVNGDGIDNDCDGEIDELPENSGSSFATADGKFIFGMGANSYQLTGYYSFDPNSKLFSSTDLNPYQADTNYKWTKPTVGKNGKVYEFTSETVIRNATDDVSVTLPDGYKVYTYYDYVNGFDSNIASAIFLVRTDSMSEHGVHLAYFDDQNMVQILDPGFEFKGNMEEMNFQYENGYMFIAKFGVNNPDDYYIINFNEQNPQAVKINFPSTDTNSNPHSKTYAGDGKFYISYRKNNLDYYTKTILLLDTTAGLVNGELNTSEVFTTSSSVDFLTMASNGKLYYNNQYGNNNDTNIYVYDPVTGLESSIAAPAGATSPNLFGTYGNTIELNGKLFVRYYFNNYIDINVKERLYELNTNDNSLSEVNPNGALNNYAYSTSIYGPYSNAYIYMMPVNPMFVYDGKLYMIFRSSNDSDNHYLMIYDGTSVELIDVDQAGGLKSFSGPMFF